MKEIFVAGDLQLDAPPSPFHLPDPQLTHGDGSEVSE